MVQVKWMAVGAVVLGLLAGPAAADYAQKWDNDDGDYDWFAANNWTLNTVPVATDDTDINEQCAEANPVVIDSTTLTANANNLRLSYTSGDFGYLKVKSDLTVAATLTVGRKGGPAKVWHESGTITAAAVSLADAGGIVARYEMSGGTLTVSGGLSVGRGDSGADSQFNQSAGTVTAGSMQWGHGGYTGGSLQYNMTGGTLTVSGNVNLGWKSEGCEFNQSGGTAIFDSLGIGTDYNDAGVGKATLSAAANLSVTNNLDMGSDGTAGGGTGTLVLDGSKTSGADLAVGGNFSADVLSTLQAVIDNAAIATATDMRKIVVTGNATFEAGSTLKVGFGSGVTPTPGTWTLMTVGGTLTDSGINLDADAGWSYTASSPLTVTYIPEPATLALLGLGGLGLLLRRRR